MKNLRSILVVGTIAVLGTTSLGCTEKIVQYDGKTSRGDTKFIKYDQRPIRADDYAVQFSSGSKTIEIVNIRGLSFGYRLNIHEIDEAKDTEKNVTLFSEDSNFSGPLDTLIFQDVEKIYKSVVLEIADSLKASIR